MVEIIVLVVVIIVMMIIQEKLLPLQEELIILLKENVSLHQKKKLQQLKEELLLNHQLLNEYRKKGLDDSNMVIQNVLIMIDVKLNMDVKLDRVNVMNQHKWIDTIHILVINLSIIKNVVMLMAECSYDHNSCTVSIGYGYCHFKMS